MSVVAIGAAYGGLYWIGRQLGLSRVYAHAPSIAFTTCAYYVTDLYGRGDWLEFLAVSSIPLLVASALDRLGRGRFTLSSFVLFVSAAFVFTGSHNLTLLWGTVLLCLAVILVVVLCGRGPVTARSLMFLAAVAVLATLVNAWALLPDLLYSTKTAGTVVGPINSFFFDTWNVVFFPFRMVPKGSTTPALFVQAPVWFIAWSVLGGAAMLIWRRHLRSLGRPWTAMTLNTHYTAIVLVMVNPLWAHMPRPLSFIPFPYRLNSYLALATAGVTGVAALIIQRDRALDRQRCLLSWFEAASSQPCL